MAFPTVTALVQFDRGPYDGDVGAATNTSVSPLEFHCKIGRTSESDVTQPGAATIVLDNSDRRYDPTHTTGPYYGKLKPARLVQIKATIEGMDFYPFLGWVESWPQTFSPPSGADIEVPLVDGLGLVGLTSTPASIYADEVEATVPTGPLAWWRFDESEGIVAHDATGNGHDGTYYGGATFNSRDGLVVGDDSHAIEFDVRTQYMRAPFADLSPLPGPPWLSSGVEAVYEIWTQGRILENAATLPNSYPIMLGGNGGSPLLWIGYGPNRKLRVGAYPYGDLYEYPVDATENGRRHIVVTLSAGFTTYTPIVYVNGALQTGTPLTTGTTTRSVLGVQIGSLIRSFPSGDATELTVDEAAIYPAGTDVADVAAHYDAGSSPWNGDGTLDRIDRVLHLLKLSSMRTFGTYPTDHRATVLGTAILGDDPVEYLQRLEATEGGRLLTLRGGGAPTLSLSPRHPLADPLAFTFTDEDTPSALHFESLTIDSGAAFVVNSVTVNYGGDADDAGGSVTLRDDASIATYGVRHRDVTTLYANGDDARAHGELVLAEEAQPRTRITELDLLPSADDRLWGPALSIQLGDRLQVKVKPQNVGARVTVDCVVEGIEHAVSEGVNEWRTTLSLSAIPTTSTGAIKAYWIWDFSQWENQHTRWYL